jgi:hypothetical protein
MVAVSNSFASARTAFSVSVFKASSWQSKGTGRPSRFSGSPFHVTVTNDRFLRTSRCRPSIISVVIKRSIPRSPRTVCNSANYIAVPNVRFGSLAAAARPNWDVRFNSESCRGVCCPARLLWARSRHRTCDLKCRSGLHRSRRQRKAPAGDRGDLRGWGFYLREGTQQYSDATRPPDYNLFRVRP